MKGSVWPKSSISLRFLEITPIYARLQLEYSASSPPRDERLVLEGIDIIGKFYIISNIFTRSDLDRSF
jgi:hypothetical protein